MHPPLPPRRMHGGRGGPFRAPDPILGMNRTGVAHERRHRTAACAAHHGHPRFLIAGYSLMPVISLCLRSCRRQEILFQLCQQFFGGGGISALECIAYTVQVVLNGRCRAGRRDVWGAVDGTGLHARNQRVNAFGVLPLLFALRLCDGRGVQFQGGQRTFCRIKASGLQRLPQCCPVGRNA